MAMGLAQNTPDYIWSARRRSLNVEGRTRAFKYVLDILQMDPSRWSYKSLREDVRGILNGVPTRLGKLMKAALDEVGDGQTLRSIWDKENLEVIVGRLKENLKTKVEQEIQRDWGRIDTSRYSPSYQLLVDGFSRADYWDNKSIGGNVKEQ